VKQDAFKHLRELSQHLSVRESDDLDATSLQPRCSFSILSLMLGIEMLTAVHFDYKSALMTVEVNDIGPYGLLPSEFRAAQLATAKMPPEGLPLRPSPSGVACEGAWHRGHPESKLIE
jgi:hypothetical protein